VDWARFWLEAEAWAKWRCPECQSLLCFDKKQRIAVTITYGLIAVPLVLAGVWFGMTIRILIVVAAIPIGVAINWWFDSIKLHARDASHAPARY